MNHHYFEVLCFHEGGHIIFQNPVVWISKNLAAHLVCNLIFFFWTHHFFTAQAIFSLNKEVVMLLAIRLQKLLND